LSPGVATAAPLHRPLAGAMVRLAAVAVLALMFALVKLAGRHGVHLVEAVFYRQAFALPFVLGWAAAGPGLDSLRTTRIGMHASRMALGLCAMSLNFLGMMMLPLAEATVIGFTVPLFATMLAALLLKERVGPWRAGAVTMGFIGILLVVRPDSAAMASTGALVALAGAVATAGVTIFIRQLGATEPAVTTVFWFTALSMIPLSLLMLVFGQVHTPQAWALLAGVGLTGAIAQLLLTASLRMAPVAVVLPMDYSGLIWAGLAGYLLFAALPAPATLLGAPIIIASGLAILWREHRLGRVRERNNPVV
jgi:drug/metabolite transporter (DMT)-like permease